MPLHVHSALTSCAIIVSVITTILTSSTEGLQCACEPFCNDGVESSCNVTDDGWCFAALTHNLRPGHEQGIVTRRCLSAEKSVACSNLTRLEIPTDDDEDQRPVIVCCRTHMCNNLELSFPGGGSGMDVNATVASGENEATEPSPENETNSRSFLAKLLLRVHKRLTKHGEKSTATTAQAAASHRPHNHPAKILTPPPPSSLPAAGAPGEFTGNRKTKFRKNRRHHHHRHRHDHHNKK